LGRLGLAQPTWAELDLAPKNKKNKKIKNKKNKKICVCMDKNNINLFYWFIH
jgi:hypothetical protein